MIFPDSDTVIHYLKGLEPVVSKWRATSPREMALPSIVAYEIEYGTLKIGTPTRRAAVSGLLRSVVQVPFDDEAAQSAAQIRFMLESRRMAISPLDVLIAATALSRNSVLATRNLKEFARIDGLRLVDWTK